MLDLDAQGAHRLHRAETIVAREKTAKHANAVSQRREDHTPVRDALVSGDRNFGLNSRSAFDAKFHVTLIIRFDPLCRAREKRRQATLSIGTIGSVVQRG